MRALIHSVRRLRTPQFFFLTLILLMTVSCGTFGPQVYSDYDEIKNESRIRTNLTYDRALEKRTPFRFLRQTVLKKIGKNGEPEYTFFETLNLGYKKYDLEDTIYLIVNGENIPIQLDLISTENKRSISEDTKQIMTADSTTMNVVTGYSQSNYHVTNTKFSISQKDMRKILSASNIYFRYYTEAYVITTELKGRKLKHLKELINTT